MPAGVWNIYASVSDCCTVNFPFSEVCNVVKGTESPTKHPTIAAVEETPFETVPLLFKVEGLPDDVNMRALKDEMKLVLTAILSMISDSVPDMKLSSIDERDARRRLGESLATVEISSGNTGGGRELLRNVDMYYDVNIIRVEGTQFGPIIIQALKEAMSDVQNRIETTKTQYLDGDIDYNICTLASGKYTLCTSTPEAVNRPAQTTTMAAEPEPEVGNGLAGWAIALIVIFVLALVAGLCYLMYISTRDGEVYDMEKDMYADEMKSTYSRKSRGGRSRKSGHSSSRSHKSGRSHRSGRSHKSGRSRSSGSRYSRRSRSRSRHRDANEGMLLALPPGQDPTFGDGFTVDTYRTAKHKPDPSVYHPRNPNAKDPDGDVTDDNGILMLTMGEDPDEYDHDHSGPRKYMEDPPLRPKREPTMYVDGTVGDDSSLYSAKYGQGSVGSAANQSADPFHQSSFQQRSAKDPSFYVPGESDRSFRTQEPSVGEASKSKRSQAKHGEDSLASSWGDVMSGMDRPKSKSFY